MQEKYRLEPGRAAGIFAFPVKRRNTPDSIPPSKATSMAICCGQHYAMPKRQFYGQTAHQSSTGSGAMSGIGGKLIVERGQGRQLRQQGFRRRWLDDQRFILLAHNGVFAGQLELARNAHRLVASVPEHRSVPRRGPNRCFSTKIGEGKPACWVKIAGIL